LPALLCRPRPASLPPRSWLSLSPGPCSQLGPAFLSPSRHLFYTISPCHCSAPSSLASTRTAPRCFFLLPWWFPWNPPTRYSLAPARPWRGAPAESLSPARSSSSSPFRSAPSPCSYGARPPSLFAQPLVSSAQMWSVSSSRASCARSHSPPPSALASSLCLLARRPIHGRLFLLAALQPSSPVGRCLAVLPPMAVACARLQTAGRAP
jgi:hypothetical protein